MLISREESCALLTESKLKEISKVLFDRIHHNPLAGDYVETKRILREVYDAGRIEGSIYYIERYVK